MPTELAVTIDPPDIEEEDLEHFLATDELFVEYFNHFLQLPTFPEPLCFNPETGGFEVVSEAKKQLANQIKAAVRSSKRTPRIYRVARQHAFIDIPLFPIVDDDTPPDVEIDTSFTVKTLNKEQGIEWVKKERLPAFLQSDCYLEYRIAKVISEVSITDDKGQKVALKIDYKPRKRRKRRREMTPPPAIDPKEEMMKNMFVCMGNTVTTDTDVWFSEAKMAHNIEVTISSETRPSSRIESVRPSSVTGGGRSRPKSGRPTSALSLGESQSDRRSDSGIGSSGKGSLFGGSSTINMAGSLLSMEEDQAITSEDEDILNSKLFGSEGVVTRRPVTPRPSEAACVISERPTSGPRFYSSETEKQSVSPSSSQVSDEIQPKITDSSTSEPPATVIFNNIDDLGAVIVATSIKQALAKLTNQDVHDVARLPSIQKLYPSPEYIDFTFDALDRVSFVNVEPDVKTADQGKTTTQETTPKTTPTEPNPPLLSKKSKEKLKDSGYESENDSLLDSDEDYEERDTFFRKKKVKTFTLKNRKGMNEFKKFLQGTKGDKTWQMWIDIDHGHLVEAKDTSWYLSAMRERYHQQGAPLELSQEEKTFYGLSEPSHWTLHNLFSVQKKLTEPLVLYWAPRFLLKQQGQNDVKPENNVLYHHQRGLRVITESHPNPATKTLLPLRPKSCAPRIKTVSVEKTTGPQISSHVMIPSSPKESCEFPTTTPQVGMKRTYNIPNNFVKYIHGCRIEKVENVDDKDKDKKNKDELVQPLLPPKVVAVPVSSGSLSPCPPASVRSSNSRAASARVKPSEKWETSSNTSKMRAKSAVDRRGSNSSNANSVFLGGRRMEGLLQALSNEKKAGHFFKMFINKSRNQLWKSCISFWQDLQDYHELFYAVVLDSFNLHKKAQFLNAQYMVEAAPHSIQCSATIRANINKCIDPPFEELFDAAEEYILSILYVAWMQMKYTDKQTYEKVELVEVKRHLETKSRYVFQLQRRGLIRQVSLEEDNLDTSEYDDPVYDESLLEKVPEEYRSFTMSTLTHNRLELEHFKHYLNDNYASNDLMCWMDIEAFKRIPHEDFKRRDSKAKEIKTKYLNKKYFFGPNSPAGKEGQELVMAAAGGWGKLLDDRPPNEMLIEVQKYVQQRLEKKWMPLFLASEDFSERQRPQSSMADAAEDIIMQRKKKSMAVWKVLESKWNSASKEIFAFRKGLLNPVTSSQFRKFVSIRGDLLENDVLFWQEVQKYKELHHSHADDVFVQNKVSTIINCFLDSQIPPSLQIDIPHEMAEKILDRRKELGPYIFRESQLTVFRVLFTHWNEFNIYRSKVADDKVLPMLERQRRRAKVKEKIRQQELSAQLDKEMTRRRVDGDTVSSQDARVDNDDEDDVIADMNNDKISWSYSQHMRGLQMEEVLNNTDETTFSSLMSDTVSMTDYIDVKETEPKIAEDSQKKKKASLTSEILEKTIGDNRRRRVSLEPAKHKGHEENKVNRSQVGREGDRSKVKDSESKSKHRMARGMPPLIEKN